MRVLRRRQFGNPVLRLSSRRLSRLEILSTATQDLLGDMSYTLIKKRYGVGLAAPQIGESLAIAIIGLKPTPTRPDIPTLSLTLINPEIVSHYGKKIAEWEGCISGPDMYGKAMRYPKVRLRWLDGHAHPHQKTFEGLVAQVIQHEVDHLNGILFVDRVTDPKTYMTFSEYKKLRAIERTAAKQNLKSPKAPISRLTASKALNS